MRKKISLLMLGVIAMLTSCSQSEDLLQVADESQQTTSMTFTVTVDNGMKTRAVGDDPDLAEIGLKAYLAQVTTDGTGSVVTTEIPADKITKFPSGDSYGFSISIDGMLEQTKYKLMFWASKAGDYTIIDNKVTMPDVTPRMAFYGTTGDFAIPSAMQTNIELKHAVAKVTLNSTTALTGGKTAKLSIRTFAAFDLLEGKASNGETVLAVSMSEADAPAGDLCSVYVLCDGIGRTQTATITLSNGSSTEVANLPVKSNNYIKLTGDVDGIGVIDTKDFAVFLDSNWNELEPEISPFTVDAASHTIKIFNSGTLTAEAVAEAIGSEGTLLKVTGPMNSNDFAALTQYFIESDENARVDLDLSGASFRILPTAAFCNIANHAPARGLGTITLPTVCKEIRDYAFDGVEAEKVIAKGVEIVRNAMINGSKVGEVIFGSAMTTMYDNAFAWPQRDITVDLSELTNEVSVENDRGIGIFSNPTESDTPEAYNHAGTTITVLVANEAMKAFFEKYAIGKVEFIVKQ